MAAGSAEAAAASGSCGSLPWASAQAFRRASLTSSMVTLRLPATHNSTHELMPPCNLQVLTGVLAALPRPCLALQCSASWLCLACAGTLVCGGYCKRLVDAEPI